MSTKGQKHGFTIIELLTVMSVIAILMALLVPALNKVRRYAKVVKQKGQFHSIEVGLEMYKIEFGEYPESNGPLGDGKDVDKVESYCGAMRLAEALVGQDGQGVHPDSRFVFNDADAALFYGELYPNNPVPPITDSQYQDNLRERRPLYIKEDSELCTLEDFYSDVVPADILPFTDPNSSVMLADAFPRAISFVTGKKVGMPVLYYKADTSKIRHTETEVFLDVLDNIYNIFDNLDLVDLEVPWFGAGVSHPMSTAGGTTRTGGVTDATIFYRNTENKKSTIEKPYNPDSYILISAGFDGEYGTNDDVFNFEN